jgi:hypothetical protein
VFLNIDYIHSNLLKHISNNIQNDIYKYDEFSLSNDENLIKKFIKLNIDDLISIIKNIEEIDIH